MDITETNKGNQRKVLQPNTPPTAQFALLDGEEVITAYAIAIFTAFGKLNIKNKATHYLSL